MMLEADLVLELQVNIGDAFEVGEINDGAHLRVIPITGGKFWGLDIQGEVIPGGADWRTVHDQRVAHTLAKYIIKTDDGVYISVTNQGYTDITKPLPVIRTTPTFQVKKGTKYDWLTSGTFAGSLKPSTPQNRFVEIKIYKLK